MLTAGSIEHFLDPEIVPSETTSLARVLMRTLVANPVGPRCSLRWDPNWAQVGPGG